jgi:hypothetical protein
MSSYVLDIRDTKEEFFLERCIFSGVLKRRLVRWTGKTYLPEGCCNTIYILKDVETKEEVHAMAEMRITRQS